MTEEVKTTHSEDHALGGNPFSQDYIVEKESMGFTYVIDGNFFIRPQPYPSWSLNENTYLWEAPLVRPDNWPNYWDEENQQWVAI